MPQQKTDLMRSTVSGNSENMTLLGRWPYGPCNAVFVEGDYAYIGNGAVMTILDISDPASPVQVGEIETPGVVRDIHVSHHHAFVADGQASLRVIDVRDPSRPVEAGRYTSGGYTSKVCVHRQLACINIGLDILILNVSAPSGPELMRRINLTENVSDLDMKTIVEKIYLFVANHTGGFRVFDINDSENPVEVDSIEDINPVYSVTISGDYAYVVGYSYLYIIDIKNPEDIELKSAFYCSHGMEEICVSDGYAYITDIYYAGLWIIDVSEPDNPHFVNYFIGNISNPVWDVHVKDRHAYLACSADGLHVLNVSAPETPVELASFDTGFFCRHLFVINEYAYIGGGPSLHIYDVSIPENLQKVGSVEINGGYTSEIDVIGNYAYFVCRDGLWIIDVSNPDEPSVTGSYHTAIDASAVYVKEDYAYLASWDGLSVIDVSNKSNPTEITFIKTENRAIEIDISRDHAYVVAVGSDAEPNLLVFNISDPINPVLACSFNIPDYSIYDIDVSGMLAYVVSMSAGLRIMDVSKPDNPVEIGAYNEGFSLTRNITIKDNFAYMTDGLNGLRIIDVSKPESPTEIDGFRTHAYGLFVQGNLAYVTAGVGGFYILRNELADEIEHIPTHISMMQNFPNPFNSETTIRFELSVPERVTLTLFDINGREVATLVDNVLYNSGSYEIEWASGALPSGVYIYRFHAGDHVETKKMILLR